MVDLRRMATLITLLALVALGGCREGPDATSDVEAEIVVDEPAGPATERSVMVLCYHAMSPGATAFYDVPTEDFAEQLALLDERGYESVLPSEIADYLEGRSDLPERAVCFTFDDNHASILTESKPLMDRYGYTGVAFLITDSVGARGSLTWDQVRELQQAGWEIGSHSHSHERLTRLSPGEIEADLRKSKAAVEEQIEGECVSLAYPYGLYDRSIVEFTGEAGYRVAFTIDRGPADWTDDPLLLPRQMVVNGNSIDTFGRWLDQEKLHFAEIDPPIGQGVDLATPAVTARLADDGVAVNALEVSVDGRPVAYEADEDARELTFSPELNEGANNLRVNYYGTPRREVSWVIIHEPN